MAVRQHPRGDAKRVVDATTQEFVDFVDLAGQDITRALAEPRKHVGAVLALFIASLKPGETFNVQDYRRFLRLLLRWKDGKVHRTPEWYAKLRARVAEALAMARMSAGHLAIQSIVAQAMSLGEAVDNINAESIAKRAKAAMATRERFMAAAFAGSMVDDIKLRFHAGIGLSNDTLLNRIQRLGGRRGRVYGLDREVGPLASEATAALLLRYSHALRRIGETEAARAYNGQAMAVMAQLNEERTVYRKRWDSSRDKKTCPVCADLHGLIADVDREFPRAGAGMGPPRHPHCRCTLSTWPVKRED